MKLLFFLIILNLTSQSFADDLSNIFVPKLNGYVTTFTQFKPHAFKVIQQNYGLRAQGDEVVSFESQTICSRSDQSDRGEKCDTQKYVAVYHSPTMQAEIQESHSVLDDVLQMAPDLSKNHLDILYSETGDKKGTFIAKDEEINLTGTVDIEGDLMLTVIFESKDSSYSYELRRFNSAPEQDELKNIDIVYYVFGDNNSLVKDHTVKNVNAIEVLGL